MSLPRRVVDALQVSRYECKYFLSEAEAAAVRRAIEPFVQPDPYAADFPGCRYPLSSLYLDSSDLALYRQSVEGTKNRFKLRIRTYSDDPSAAAYLEIKKRADLIILKRRAAVERRHILAWIRDSVRSRSGAGFTGMAAGHEFVSLAHRVAARPMMRVRYLREAYESPSPGAIRITFDTEVMYCLSPDGELGTAGETWQRTPTEGVILEIKFTERFPTWIRTLIDSVQLQKRSIPKYALSVDDARSRPAGVPGQTVLTRLTTPRSPGWRS